MAGKFKNRPVNSSAPSLAELASISSSITIRSVVAGDRLGTARLDHVTVIARYVIDVGGIDWSSCRGNSSWFIMAEVVLALQSNLMPSILIMNFSSFVPAKRFLVSFTNPRSAWLTIYLFFTRSTSPRSPRQN